MHKIFHFLLFFQLLTNSAVAEESAKNATTINYKIDASLLYLDQYSLATTNQINATKTNLNRTLGLRFIKLDLNFHTSRTSQLRFLIRPDAQRGDSPATRFRDFDTRSGEPYRAESRVQFLDAYELNYFAGNSLTFSAGVMEGFEPKFDVFWPFIAEFGLRVRFPEKFFGARADWDQNSSNGLQLNRHTRASLFAIQGHEDRSETGSRNERSFDTAPESQDKYFGGALRFDNRNGKHLFYSILVGTLDTKYDDVLENETFGKAFIRRSWNFGAGELSSMLEVRYLKNSFRDSPVNAADRVQQNTSISNAFTTDHSTYYLFGFHIGKSDRALDNDDLSDVSSIDGYQIDLGINKIIAESIDVRLGFTDEFRKYKDENDDTIGGIFIQDADGFKKQKRLKRMGLEIRYLLFAKN